MLTNLYKKFFLSTPLIGKIVEEINLNKKTEISEASREIVSLISLCYSELKKQIVIVAPNTFHAQKIYDSLSLIMDDVYFYPKDDFISTELLTESFDFKLQRINSIKAILSLNRPYVVVMNLAALLSKAPLKEDYIKNIITLKKEDVIKPKVVVDVLINAGYERSYTIEKQGEFSLRGSILDIFPINSVEPFRIDFFGDEIETIKTIDIETQRSKKEEKEIVIMPKQEILFNETEKEAISFFINDKLSSPISEKSKERFKEDLNTLENNEDYSRLQKYLSFFINYNYSILDYIENKIVFFYDYLFIKNHELTINNQIYDYLSNYDNYFNVGSFLNSLNSYEFEKEVYFNPKKMFSSLKEITLTSREPLPYNNNLELFKNDLINEKEKTIILSLTEENKETLKEFFKNNKISYIEPKEKIKNKTINIINDSFIPLDIKELNVLALNDDLIFKFTKSLRKGGKYSLSVETKRLKSISELKIGDYVVHQNYGIGKFQEITTMTLRGHTNDFIHIKYNKDQSVYVPVENFNTLSKYAGSESFIPKLSDLNTKEWEKAKQSAKNKAKELAQRLLSLYSEREHTKGFKYLEDDDVQKQFENEFKYELTKDQEKAIEDVKNDMESDALMDRLICGDVGFGKTEIALRAAFKAVLSGVQVVYLAPTTILSRQHYYTFLDRMEKYGVNVALVNRFVEPKEIKKHLANLKRGTVDIIIGTHRLLSKDVEFKNLGLLIIDEEQRFGVEAKEKIKELKRNVDVLTLTATPIPRTLEMAITGLKNISLIETPPKGRYPIQTYVLERNDFIVKDAIEREIAKGGQVFYLYNRVEDMDSIVRYVHTLVPEIKTTVIHGKMDRNEIEDSIEAFINKESDVLISTTIIETGVDIPNANTLIVHDADRYGLAQLYQIKGRVGRSDKISYAYLMYDKNKILTEEATKRLKAIKDFAELGSGFKIAIRDLSTRGAGEILGKEQSGFMDKVGVDLYLKMLDEEIKTQKGEIRQNTEQDIRVLMSRHIDKDYISDDYVLIEVHNKISSLSSKDELIKLTEELKDRFGPVNDSLREYMYTKLSENLINECSFERTDINERSALFVLSSERSGVIDAQNLFKLAYETSINFNFYYKVKRIFLSYTLKESKLKMYEDISSFLEKVLKQNIL